MLRQREEVGFLKSQLAEAQGGEKERKRLADKVDKFELKVRPYSLAYAWEIQLTWE